jgi:xanthine dehydrogenase accessory factor
MRLDAEAIHRRVAELLEARKQFVVATILEVKGSAPQVPGKKMLIHPDGSIEFTIGGGTFEAEVIQDALAMMRSPCPVTREYKLTRDELGMYCQGLVKVFFENQQPRARLIIFGGGHVGQALSRLSSASGLYEVLVIDDRSEFADPLKHPGAARVIQTDREFTTDVPVIDPYTFLVIVTRCHATDKLLVKRYLSSPAGYVGLIGSRAKVRQFRRELLEEGISVPELDRLHAPIVLPIGGKDPAEVAVSILAQLIQERHQAQVEQQPSAFQIKKRQS